VEVSALNHLGVEGLRGPTPLLRLQSDDRLVTLTRRGNQAAYEALVGRYQSRLLAFCRHMLGSREDAEDVLQEVFAAAFNAMIADERSLNVRPWLYRIARNRSLNHLRRATAIGVDSMDVHLAEGGATTADKVHRREDFRLLIEDVRQLPETQRTALLLREIDALSYEQIAEAMETTVPSIKSLLVRARVSLAEAAEARQLTCDEVREELGEVAEGLRRTTAPVRRHLRGCDRCSVFRKQLRATNKALAAVYPVGPFLLLKKVLLAHLGTTAGAGGGAAAGGAAAGAAAGVGAGAGAATAGGALTAGMGAIASKAAAGLAAAAIVTAGVAEVDHVRQRRVPPPAPVAAVPARPVFTAPPRVVASQPQPVAPVPATAAPRTKPAGTGATRAPAVTPVADKAHVTGAPAPLPQQESDTTTLPVQTPGAADRTTGGTVGPAEPTDPAQLAPAPAPAPAPAAAPAPATPEATAPPPAQPTEPPPPTDPPPPSSPPAAAPADGAPTTTPSQPRAGAAVQPTRSPSAAPGSGASSSTPPSLYVPSTRTSERTGPTWRGGKFTTATTRRPSSASRG
jgi:RNA polymerase sigma factor (sigma-70 family)